MFAPSLERGITTPVFAFGAPTAQIKEPVFTCPVSAIAPEVNRILEIFFVCRSMRALPRRGAVEDQPLIIQRAFPILELEMQQIEALQREHASMSGMKALMGALAGRGRRSP